MPIDYSDYPHNWTEIRERILLRDQHRCNHCGVENYSIGYRSAFGKFTAVGWAPDAAVAKELKARLVPQYPQHQLITIILTVAHLDHDEWNHAVTDNRLAALCQRCHFQYDREDNDRRKKYGKHYKRKQIPLFK